MRSVKIRIMLMTTEKDLNLDHLNTSQKLLELTAYYRFLVIEHQTHDALKSENRNRYSCENQREPAKYKHAKF